MKCIPSCGYSEKPDNLNRLVRHLEDCLSTGASKRLKKDPYIIWKDGEFTVSEKKTKKDRVFDVQLKRKVALELKETQIKRVTDYAKEIQVTPGTVSDTVKKPAKRIKADIPDELKS